MLVQARFDKRVQHIDLIHRGAAIKAGMDLEKSWSERLIEKGVHDGRLEMLELLLAERFGKVDPAVTHLTRRSHDDAQALERWAASLATAGSLEDVFGESLGRLRKTPPAEEWPVISELSVELIHPDFTPEMRAIYLKHYADSYPYELAVAQYLVQKGKQQVQQGILLQMLMARFGRIKLEFEEKTWYANSEQLCRWAVKVLTAGTVEEVFQEG